MDDWYMVFTYTSLITKYTNTDNTEASTNMKFTNNTTSTQGFFKPDVFMLKHKNRILNTQDNEEHNIQT